MASNRMRLRSGREKVDAVPPRPSPVTAAPVAAAAASASVDRNDDTDRSSDSPSDSSSDSSSDRSPDSSPDPPMTTGSIPSAPAAISASDRAERERSPSPPARPFLIPSSTPSVEDSDSDSDPSSPTSDGFGIKAQACNHILHPSYSKIYKNALCPLCRLHTLFETAYPLAKTLMSHGGFHAWREQIIARPESDKTRRNDLADLYSGYKTQSKAERKGNVHIKTGTYGKRPMNFPRVRTQLLALVDELEILVNMERIWERAWDESGQGYPSNWGGSEDEAKQQVIKTSRATSATKALDQWTSLFRPKIIGEVTRQAAAFSRKRGREMEIAAAPDYPDPQDYLPSGNLGFQGAFVTTREQREFIASSASTNSYPQEQAVAEYGRAPKRQRTNGSHVRFDESVYVRAHWDVDQVFRVAEVLPANFANAGPLMEMREPHMHPLPERPFHVHPLKEGSKLQRRRDSSAPENERVVDTSGHTLDWEDWEAHVEELQREGSIVMILEDIREFKQAQRRSKAEAEMARNELWRNVFSAQGALLSVFALGGYVGEAVLEAWRMQRWW